MVGKAGEIQLHSSMCEKRNCIFWYLLRRISWSLIKSLFTGTKKKKVEDSTDIGETYYLVVNSTLAGSLAYPNI